MRKIRTCVSCISKEQCQKFRAASISVEPNVQKVSKKSDVGTDEVVRKGVEAMKCEGFQLAKGLKSDF